MRKALIGAFCALAAGCGGNADSEESSLDRGVILENGLVDTARLQDGECIVIGEQPKNATQLFLNQATHISEVQFLDSFGEFAAPLSAQMQGRSVCTVSRPDDQLTPAYVSPNNNRTNINIAMDVPEKGYTKDDPVSYTLAMGMTMIQENAHEATNRELCEAGIDVDNLWQFSPREAVATNLVLEAMGWAAEGDDKLHLFKTYNGPQINLPVDIDILNAMNLPDDASTADRFIAGMNAFLAKPDLVDSYAKNILRDYEAALDSIETIDPEVKKLAVGAFEHSLTTENLFVEMIDFVDWSKIGDGTKPDVSKLTDVMSDDFDAMFSDELKVQIEGLQTHMEALREAHTPFNEVTETSCERWGVETDEEFYVRQIELWQPTAQ